MTRRDSSLAWVRTSTELSLSLPCDKDNFLVHGRLLYFGDLSSKLVPLAQKVILITFIQNESKNSKISCVCHQWLIVNRALEQQCVSHWSAIITQLFCHAL